jgi:Tfp pilus assembly protein PilF
LAENESLKNTSDRRINRRSSRTRIAVRILVGIFALFVAASIGWQWKGEEFYRRWNRRRWQERAETALALGRLEESARAAKQVLDIDANNLAALRVIATVTDLAQMPDAIIWRRRLFELEPWNPTNRLAYAKSAMDMRDYFSAAQALKEYPTNPPPSAGYLDLAGAVSLALGDVAGAQKYFIAAIRADPTNAVRQLNLAEAEMESHDPADGADARERLKRLLAAPTTRPEALRLLVGDAVRRRSREEAGRYADDLSRATNATFTQRIASMAAHRLLGSPGAAEELASLQKISVRSPDTLASMIGWMNLHDLAPDALVWAKSLDPELLKAPMPARAHAQTLEAVNDWLGLRHWCRSSSWGTLEAVRLAYDTLAEQRLNQATARPGQIDALWSRAITAAKKNTQILEALASLAAGWGMRTQAEAALWAGAESPYSPDSPLGSLYRFYLRTDNALGQFRVARRMLELRPTEIVPLNNYVYLGFLLGFNEPAMASRLRDLEGRAGTNAVYISTVAFSKFRTGDPRGAVDLMSKLPVETQKRPAMAALQVIFFAAADDPADARRWLAFAEGAKLLPEEKKLLDDARKKVFGR